MNTQQITLHHLLKAMLEQGASDLHLTAGSPPQLRVDGSLKPLPLPPLGPNETKSLCYSVLTEEQRNKFQAQRELDLSFGVKNLSRFRANIFLQRGAVTGAFRTIPFEIKSIQQLGLPPVVARLTQFPRGLILVTGPTGSGKSTTLAALLDKINEETRQHIVTIEDPIEYLHPNKNCIVNQREIGSDSMSFKGALKYVLRQDPDVVLIGEMRDLETIEAAMTISETGHLVFATLHTNGAIASINRIIDVFPPHQQAQIRSQLSFVLQGVISQTLVPKKTGRGRVPALEIMLPNAAIRNLIRENKIHQAYSAMLVGQEDTGMRSMNQSLHHLVTTGEISYEQAVARCTDIAELNQLFEAH